MCPAVVYVACEIFSTNLYSHVETGNIHKCIILVLFNYLCGALDMHALS